MVEIEILENIFLFMKQNWLVLLLLLGLVFIVVCGVKRTLKSLFLGVKYLDRIFLFLSILGFFGQIILFKNEFFKTSLQLTLVINILLFWLFINRSNINNEEFNAVVLIFLVGMSAYCMIISGQEKLYNYEIFYNIIYAGIYIAIPMFVAWKMTSKEQKIINEEDILNKLSKVEDKLINIEKSIHKPSKVNYQSLNCKRKNK